MPLSTIVLIFLYQTSPGTQIATQFINSCPGVSLHLNTWIANKLILQRVKTFFSLPLKGPCWKFSWWDYADIINILSATFNSYTTRFSLFVQLNIIERWLFKIWFVLRSTNIQNCQKRSFKYKNCLFLNTTKHNPTP